ncbi:MAG: hypothetical protein ACK58L_01115 [Planctomycetota bacterium]
MFELFSQETLTMISVRLTLFAIISFVLVTSGCSEDGGPTDRSHGEAAMPESDGHDHSHSKDHDHGNAHSHPTEGPHHGHLVELGNEEFHAELLHDQSTVTIYVLDASARTAVAIESPDVLINLQRDGKPEQFKLNASAEASDPPGKASRFILQSEELVRLLEQGDSEARLSLTINGTPYSGSLAHEHHEHSH